MSYKQLKWMILLIPTLTVGLWEYIRHQLLMPYLSMGAGNWLTPLIVYIVSVTLLSRLFTMMETARSELERERASKASLEAREQLARELHDGIAQSLFLLSVKLDKAKRHDPNPAITQDLQEITKTVHEVNRYVRQAISDLREVHEELPEEPPLDLRRKVAALTESILPGTLLDWHIADDQLVPREQAELLACIREGLLNARKHAQAERTAVVGRKTRTGWEVVIEDDGIGITGDPLLIPDRYGLRITRERAAQMGWMFSFEHEPGCTRMIIQKEETL
ncbi:histidine kinase [Paenibacillus sp. JX-17]|uniref:histidine kinase n=1 Tax=Paenibacillus lacisoli TaxID=3064525 RepID=A0ABT9CC06_9BACL|nr:histidine kinase [Paenibacillus sp. JX-17]MDO7906798.1 histidine kinase [Paenibacillus sp. JX-17]